MKLYTEEQVIKMLIICHDSDLYEHIGSYDDILKTETPIVLPIDEEIDYEWEVGCTDYLNGCNYGAKWMRDKIQGGNK